MGNLDVCPVRYCERGSVVRNGKGKREADSGKYLRLLIGKLYWSMRMGDFWVSFQPGGFVLVVVVVVVEGGIGAQIRTETDGIDPGGSRPCSRTLLNG